MKRTTWMMAGLSLLLFAAMAAAQTSTMDQPSEKAVHITQGPTITNITGNSATIHWTTDKVAANHVKYRVAGSGNWQSAYHPGGSKDHSLQLTGLQPGQTYEWQILTRDGDIRTSGQFQTAATAGGTAPDVSAASAGQPGAAMPAAPGAATGAKVPLYRFVNASGAHLYTTNASEGGQGGFRPEGTVGSLLASQADGTAALYRLASPSGDSFLTRDTNERASAIANGLRDQGVAGYIATSQQPGTEPLYRLYNAGAGQHFYTTSESERQGLIRRGVKDEGIIGYVWQQ